MPSKQLIHQLNFCKTCAKPLDYSYSIHRLTFHHKLLTATKINNSYIYNNSVDLDATAEHLNINMIRQPTVKKPRKPKQQQQQQQRKPRQTTLEKLRQQCAKQTTHLAPKTVLKCPKAINKVLLSQQQHLKDLHQAAINQAHDDDILSTYDDLDDFAITPRTALSTMMKTIKPTNELLPPLDISYHSVKPSPQIDNNLNNTNLFSWPYCPANPITSTQLECAEAVHFLKQQQQQQHNTEPETTSPTLKHTITPPTTTLLPYYNNDDDDMFDFTQHINHPLAIKPTTNTQTPILHNAQPWTPQSPTHKPQLLEPILKNIQACINSPDHNLPASYRFTFNLIPLTFSETNYTDDIACRRCRNNINFDMLPKIPDHLPTGGQIFCAACLLLMAS